MYKLCIFAGTSEGRELVEFLAGQEVCVTVCVATEYGQTLLPAGENLMVHAGRMDEARMRALFSNEGFHLVIDATHPYAAAVTDNIRAACAGTDTRYLRLLRAGSGQEPGAVYVPDLAAAVAWLENTQGNILLTTGSKELKAFSALTGFAHRVWARVLPMEDSLRLCREAGLPAGHILAMQGPFSTALNKALLEAADARYLVSKDSGLAGGFPEKLAAAQEAGVTLVVIGRPPQVEGLDVSQTVALLCREFALQWRPKVALIGMGPGSRGGRTLAAEAALANAQCVIGAQRLLEDARRDQRTVAAVAPEQIVQAIRGHREYSRFAVVMSGDVGFFSGAKKLLPLLEGWDVEVHPGLSSLVCLCARLGTSYEDVVSVSLHGRDRDIVADVRKNRRLFVLTGGDNGAGKLCRRLTQAGLGQVRVWVGERLSYPDEKITQGTAQELAQGHFAPLNAVLVEHDGPDPVLTPGLPDEQFQRTEGVPMTKSEVRAVCLSKLALTRCAVCWDVGAGTGSVSIEMARLADLGQVFAVECRADALETLERNRRAFGLENLTAVPGLAPEACRDLPSPTHVFIGGSRGNLRPIVELALEKNPEVRVVATAVSLETLAELTACAKELGFALAETVSITVAKGRRAGSHTLMTGQNPIYIFTMGGTA